MDLNELLNKEKKMKPPKIKPLKQSSKDIMEDLMYTAEEKYITEQALMNDLKDFQDPIPISGQVSASIYDPTLINTSIYDTVPYPSMDWNVKKSHKKHSQMDNPYADPYAILSKKDLIGTIRNLLEEQGRTAVSVPKAGSSYTKQDTIITYAGEIMMLTFRSLIDAKENQDD